MFDLLDYRRELELRKEHKRELAEYTILLILGITGWTLYLLAKCGLI